LEKPQPRSDEGYIKDGFHLHFPMFICESWFYNEIVRPVLVEYIKNNFIFDKCNYCNDVDKIVDTNIMTKQWCMYGSTSKDKSKPSELRAPYLVTNVFKGIINENDPNGRIVTTYIPPPLHNDESSKSSEEFEKILESELTSVFSADMQNKKYSVFYHLPRLLSIRGYPETTPLQERVSQRRKKTTRVYKRPMRNVRRPEDIAKDYKYIVDAGLMDMLSSERSDSYDKWMDVGWTLFNIGAGAVEFLELWIEFSKMSPSFQDGKCEEEWNKMNMSDKTIGSLLAMARADSPEEYRKWRKRDLNYYLLDSLNEDHPNEWDVSEVVRVTYSDRFVCADSKKDVWYEFRGHKWYPVDDGIALKSLFVKEIKQLYIDFNAEIGDKLRDLKFVEDRNQAAIDENKYIKQQAKCRKIITALKSVSFHDKLMRMCKLQFHNALFLKNLDSNLQLFGCENGVIDLKAKIFREGRPDDYISLSCGHDFNTNYDMNHPDVQKVITFMRQIFPDENLYNYFSDATCASLEGGNTNKIFLVHTGEPDGGKSAMMEYVNFCWGEYYGTFPSELLLKGPGVSSDKPRPELVQAKGKRIMDTKELPKDGQINMMYLKLLTGNDNTFQRGLHSNGGVFKPQYTLWMSCNEPPEFPANETAVWERSRFLPYESKFVKPRSLAEFPVPDTEEERFRLKRWHADPSIVSELKEVAPAFLWLMFKRYLEYKPTGGIKDTEKVIAATQKIKHLNDFYLQYIRDRIEEVSEDDQDFESTFLSLKDLQEDFKMWVRDNGNTKERWTRVKLETEFSKRFGKTITIKRVTGWKKYRIAKGEEFDDIQQELVKEVLAKKKHQ
jgi:phage/plasmid-associated DNA primase